MAVPVASLRAVIGVDGDEVAAAKLAGFGTKIEETSTRSTRALGRIGVAAETVDHQLAHFGVPFTSSAGRVITSFGQMEARGTSLGSRLSNLGRTEATAAALGLAAVATEGVHLADSFELAHARLETASKNAGLDLDGLTGAVGKTDKSMEHLGFTNADTESSLARLLTRTHNMAQAQRDEQIAANVSAGTHKDLATATNILVQVESGRYTQLSRLGLASKAQIAGFHDERDAVNFLANTMKGQAAAAADTFAGRMKVLSAEGQDLGATIGVAVVPKIETAAQVALTGVHSFQSLNTATHGLSGEVLGLAAAFPIAVYAGGKLISAGKAIAGTYQDTAAWLKNFGTTTTATAASAEASATAVATARQIEAAAATQAGAAEKAFQTALAQSAEAEDGDLAAAVALTTATDQLAAAKARLAVASEATAEAETVAAAEGAAAGTSAFGMGAAFGVAGIAAVGLISIIHSLGQADRDTKKYTDDLTSAVQQQGVTLGQATQQKIADFISTLGPARELLDKTGISATDLSNAIQHGGPALDEVNHKLSALGNSNVKYTQGARFMRQAIDEQRTAFVDAKGQIEVHNQATDQLRGTQTDATKSTDDLTGATRGASGALDDNAGHVHATSYAYLGLADSVHTAAGALAGSIAQATGSGSPYQLQLDTSAAQASALALHGKLDSASSGGGGGGAGETATAAAINQKEKELALRDALRQVGTTATQVTDAEKALSDARGRQATANQALIVAENNYKAILDGVSASSKTARDAQVALTQARLDAQQQDLSAADAERALEHAKNDRALSPFGVTDAQRTLTTSQGAAATANQATTAAEQQLATVRASGTATAADIAAAEQAVANARAAADPLNEQVTKDEVALNDARIDAKAGDEAVTKAELDLKNERIQSKQKTDDLATAQQTLGYILHGYPKDSEEARTATQNLRDAQKAQKDAVDGVTKAVQDLITAQDGIATSALGVERAQADLDGKLTKAAGSGGGMGKLETTAGSLIGKLDDLRQKSITVAQDVAANITAATGSYGQGVQAFIESLRLAVANEPLLAGAFDSVIAKLQGDYQKWLYKQPLTPITGRGGIGKTPNSPTAHTGAGTGDGSTFNLPGHAAGGYAAPGTTFTTGEQGWELGYARPDGGIDFLSNPQSRHALGSGGDLHELLGQIVQLIASQRPGVHIDNLIARDAEDTVRKIDQQQKRQYLLTNL